jgi:predicted amidohydrolase
VPRQDASVMVAAYQAPLLPFGSMNEAWRLVEEQVSRCEAAGVRLLCCPEAILGGLASPSDGDDLAAVGVTLDELAQRVSRLSSGVVVVLGFTERADHGYYNSAAIVRRGRILGVQRKLVPGGNAPFMAGRELEIFECGGTAFGVAICNDAHFIEPAHLMVSRGADMLLVPVWGAHKEPRATRWRARGTNVLVARAVENGVPLIAADVAGIVGERVSFGSTAIIDGDGDILASGDPLTESLVMAEVEPRASEHPHFRLIENETIRDAFGQLWSHDRQRR